MTLRIAIIVAVLATASSCRGAAKFERVLDADAIIIGAGISGLSAAVEMGRSGVDVLVVDMNSVPGGHAVLAGGFAIVATPAQNQAGIDDHPDLAYEDWMAWTDGGDPEWTRFYAENSRAMIYDWVTEMGVEWRGVLHIGQENSVPRFHFSEQGALGVVKALVRTALGLSNVHFLWNQRVEHLTTEDGRVIGVELTNTRTGAKRKLYSEHVVLATGGFEGNLDRVLAHWPPTLPVPERLLIGASPHARGQGLDLAREMGANLSHLDRHYVYFDGTVDVRDPGRNFAITVRNTDAMWVNSEGERFTNETGFDKTIIADLLSQKTATYWAVFDEAGRDGLTMLGVEWIHMEMDGHALIDNPTITTKAMTLAKLAELTGLPPDTLVASVQRYNNMIEAGEDTEFARFAAQDAAPPRIIQAPFYAIRFFPTTRKSMGGVAIDMQTRALDDQGAVVPGLYAIGELTGSVGINGEHGMAGMFLGPGIVTGRVAGRSIITALANRQSGFRTTAPVPEEPLSKSNQWDSSLTADNLEALIAEPRNGYWHFQRSHEIVLEQKYQCSKCHSAIMPFFPVDSRRSKLAQVQVCSNCHGRW